MTSKAIRILIFPVVRVKRLIVNPRGGVFKKIISVLLFGVIVLPFVGYFRGPKVDEYLTGGIEEILQQIRDGLTVIVIEPNVVTALMWLLQFGLFAGMSLALAWLVSRIPSLVGFLVLSEYQRRRGHVPSKFEIVMGITVPIGFGITIFSYTLVSLFAWIGILLMILYVRLMTDPVRINRMLDWNARVQGGLDNPYTDEGEDPSE